MKTKGKKHAKVNIVTLGCAKNLVDSEVMLTQLRGNQIDAKHESMQDDSNIIIVNTCGFIASAKEESIDTILRYADAKKTGEIEKLYITGCLSHRYRDELREEISEVDGWYGTNELPQLLRRFKADYKKELLGDRIITTSDHFAYLKISEGCDRPCSFCAIPLMRGGHVSRSMEELVTEARSLVARGVREILLIAQDSTYYGLDLYGKRNLSELLIRLSDIDGLDWIRIHYAFPTGFPEDVLEVMASRSNICNYLDIPLQHGSSRMLKIMRRGTTREKTESLLDKIRSKIPEIAIRTTMITGHPGENQEDFDELMDFVERNRFERMGVFTYSHEEQTHSFTMEDDIPEETKQQRASQVMELQEQISEDINSSKIGDVLKVLVDRFEGGTFIGRTEFDSPEVDNEVIIDTGDQHLRIGDFTHVKITKTSAFDLYGNIA